MRTLSEKVQQVKYAHKRNLQINRKQRMCLCKDRPEQSIAQKKKKNIEMKTRYFNEKIP